MIYLWAWIIKNSSKIFYSLSFLVSQAEGLTIMQRHLKAPSSMKTNLVENIPILQTLGSYVNEKHMLG